MVHLTAEVQTPDGPLKGKVAIYSGPTHLAELIPPIQALLDGLVVLSLKREQKQGRQISCRPGCCACCRHMVPLSIPETFYMRDLVAGLPPDKKQIICRRFEQIFDKLEQAGLNARMRDPDITDESNLVLAREYFEMGIACPFLENESCSIYPARPLACREYFVTTPAEWCTRPFDHQISKTKTIASMPVVLAHLAADVLSLPGKLVPLTLSLHWAIENEELHRRTWPGRQLFEQFLAKFNSWSKHSPRPETAGGPQNDP